jgi:hypothetical protein
MDPKSTNPAKFQDFLASRWNDGVRRGRVLFDEARQQGYTGSFSHLERLLNEWRLARRTKRAPTKVEYDAPVGSKTGLYGIRRFAQVLRRDIDAVRNAITERWSNGRTEGQINRLKTLKRAMYGRAGTELLRARMVPLRL